MKTWKTELYGNRKPTANRNRLIDEAMKLANIPWDEVNGYSTPALANIVKFAKSKQNEAKTTTNTKTWF